MQNDIRAYNPRHPYVKRSDSRQMRRLRHERALIRAATIACCRNHGLSPSATSQELAAAFLQSSFLCQHSETIAAVLPVMPPPAEAAYDPAEHTRPELSHAWTRWITTCHEEIKRKTQDMSSLQNAEWTHRSKTARAQRQSILAKTPRLGHKMIFQANKGPQNVTALRDPSSKQTKTDPTSMLDILT